MKTVEFLLNNSKPFELEKTSAKASLSEVFAERQGCLNESNLFIVHFNAIPNLIAKERIDCEKANQWFLEKYHSEIKKHYFVELELFRLSPNFHIVYVLFDDLIVSFDFSYSTAKFLFSKTEYSKVQTVINEVMKFTKRNRTKRRPSISLLVNSSDGLKCEDLEITKPKLRIADNYNDDFEEIHKTIFKRLSKKNDKGLVLLHGKPGTGKTSYIRYLITSLKKDIIFLPPNMASVITSPNLLSVLIANPNSVFVIEDAENILIDRETNESSPVSALLNVSDGLLSDCLNIQIICSFNTDLSKIDEALLRRGRLIAKYEFKELETYKAQQLSNKLGFKEAITQPMTLTAIYNHEEQEFKHKDRVAQLGFKLAKAGF